MLLFFLKSTGTHFIHNYPGGKMQTTDLT